MVILFKNLQNINLGELFMSMTSSIVLFGVFIIAYGIMTEIFTILFQLTGIAREKARTQVISLLTNSGFTTTESEIIMSSKKRRRIARVTMMFGYCFAVIIVSIMVNVFLSMNTYEVTNLLGTVSLMGILVILYICTMRLKKVRHGFNSIIEKLGNRVMYGKKSNALVLIDMVSTKAMVQIMVRNVPSFLQGTPLSESNLKQEYNIQILYIERNGELLDVVDGETIIRPKDILCLFGEFRKIKSAFIPKTKQHKTR